MTVQIVEEREWTTSSPWEMAMAEEVVGERRSLEGNLVERRPQQAEW
jgi:hypothetical protein